MIIKVFFVTRYGELWSLRWMSFSGNNVDSGEFSFHYTWFVSLSSLSLMCTNRQKRKLIVTVERNEKHVRKLQIFERKAVIPRIQKNIYVCIPITKILEISMISRILRNISRLSRNKLPSFSLFDQLDQISFRKWYSTRILI